MRNYAALRYQTTLGNSRFQGWSLETGAKRSKT